MTGRAQEIFSNFMTLKRLGHAHFSESLGQYDCGLVSSQIEVLFTVQKLGPLSFKDLAQHLMLQPAAVTQSFESLAKLGYVDRKVCEDDRRTYHISITDSGVAKLKELEPYVQVRKQLISDALTSEEIDTFINLQQKIIDQMQTALQKLKEK